MDTNRLSAWFNTFAKAECACSSDLYEYLSLKIAEDHDLLALSSNAKEGQPVPNLFFGVIHFLLLNGVEHPLCEFYPSIVEKPQPPQKSFPYFKSFCLTYKDQLISLLNERKVQTNEVRRCGYLYPTFFYIYEKVKKPLALIEIGTSAGFQLLWDHYSYSYHADERYGNHHSAVHIFSEIKGKNMPPLPNVSPPVTYRYGLDLHINDLSKTEDTLWLKALIWPEHQERRALFEQASGYVNKHQDDLHLIEGDGVEHLPRIVEHIPNDSAICIFHTHVANQMPLDKKQALLAIVKKIGKNRDVFHLYNNIWDGDLHLDSFIYGKEDNEIIAQTDGHGRWFKWLA